MNIQKSTWLHLRIPFSIFLMPVFLFALSQATQISWANTLIAFVAIHIFLYPASNGYNSYFDKDKESIGGLEKPPAVEKELYYVSLIFDFIAILLGLWISWEFALALFIYGMISKAYSHPSVRIKKMPLASWFIVGFFQGFFTYIMSSMAIQGVSLSMLNTHYMVVPAILAMMLLLGSYPMTQVYQHNEDRARGDRTLSLLLGVRGTFALTAFAFMVANVGFVFYFLALQKILSLWIFELSLLPVLAFFGLWFWKVLKDERNANFKNTMLLNKISSICLSIAFMLMKVFES